MNQKHEDIFNKLHKIYSKHRKKYSGNPDSGQLCCMWSTSNPPGIIYETDPHYDLEDQFDISIDEDQLLDLYDMKLEEAVFKIAEIMQVKC